jgi:hypothetical protein
MFCATASRGHSTDDDDDDDGNSVDEGDEVDDDDDEAVEDGDAALRSLSLLSSSSLSIFCLPHR